MRSQAELHHYQQRTISAFYERDAVQAVLPMGAGKTVCALTAIDELIRDDHIRCALVVAPKRVAQLVWPTEVKQWEHLKHLRVELVSGGPLERSQALGRVADVYVVGVDNTQWLVEYLKAFAPDHPAFDCLVIDELSRFKNPRSKRAKALMKVRSRFKNVWGLTGTPRPNGYQDQFKPLTILTNGKLWGKAFDPWRERYFMSDYMRLNWTLRPEWEQKLVDDINKVTVTIDEADMPSMPPLTTVVHWVDLPPFARQFYNEMETELVVEIHERGIAAVNMAVATGKLAQIANGYLYAEGRDDVEHLHDEKYDLLEELLEDLGENALITYEYVEGLRLLRDRTAGLPYLGAGISDNLAGIYEQEWNARRLPRLALHPASAGHGLNLQHGGSQMFWPELTWSSELYDQTVKRFHRPGQARPCFNHIILARDTIDEEKYNRVVMKMNAQDAFVRLLKKV